MPVGFRELLPQHIFRPLLPCPDVRHRRGWRTTFGLYPLEQLQRSWHAENKRRRGGAEKADRDNVPGVDLLAAYRKEFEARGLEPPDVEDPPPEEPSTPAGRGRGIVFRR